MNVATKVGTLGGSRRLLVATLLAGGVAVPLRALASAARGLDGMVSARVGGKAVGSWGSAEEAGLFVVSPDATRQLRLSELVLVTHVEP